jgi:hypothetical protein
VGVVGLADGWNVGLMVEGLTVGLLVGFNVGLLVDGIEVGFFDGSKEGFDEGISVGFHVFNTNEYWFWLTVIFAWNTIIEFCMTINRVPMRRSPG